MRADRFALLSPFHHWAVTMQGLDYSAGRISGAAIKRAGYGFVVRYVDDPAVGLSSKHITPSEFADLTGAGVTVWLVFEIDINDALGGFNAGVANARRARAGADWIGYPQGGVIFMACDEHLSGAQIDTAQAYLEGAASVLGKGATGAYGFWEDVDAAIAGSHATWFWQCGIAPADTDPVHIWQRNVAPTAVTVGGVACDINDLLRPIGGGAPDMQLSDGYKDWAGNNQTVQSTFDHLDQRTVDLLNMVRDLHRVVLEPGSVTAHDPTHTKTNLADLIADIAAWELAQGNQLTALQGSVTAEEAHVLGALKGLTTGTTDVNALAAALVPLLPQAVTADELVAAFAAHLSTPTGGTK